MGQGQAILSLSTNYQGGNAASVSRQIAGGQYQNTKDAYDTQRNIIAKQRDLANKNTDNATALRSIAAQSATSTASLVDLDQTIVNGAQAALDALKSGGGTPEQILQAEQGLAAAKAALIQTSSSAQSLAVQSNSASADIASIQHDIALAQLDVQERALKAALDVAGLQLRLAQIMEANMFPASPFAGTVDKIFVHEGDSVNPGTLLAQVSGDSQHAEVVVSAPGDIARNISNFYPSTLYFEKQVIHRFPSFVSLDATGTLYSVILRFRRSEISNLTDSAYIQVKISGWCC